jgi:outer membrane protein assembly factor BamC
VKQGCFDPSPQVPPDAELFPPASLAERNSLEIDLVTRFTEAPVVRVAALAFSLALVGCSSVENVLSGDKIDYRSAGNRTSGLEVPPDLTQLAKDTRYQPPSGTVTASSFQSASAAATTAPLTSTVAPQAIGSLRIERLGNERWLASTLPPDQVYPLIRSFWKDSGFVLVQDRADAGVMETDWAENRAKLPNDLIRNSIGKIFDGAYSTGELDKFRTRVERTPTGSDIYITHRGMIEVYIGELKESTIWQPRPTDPQLEAEFLSRLMIKLGTNEEVARSATAAPATGGPARARVLAGRPAATLQLDDGFDRAWRRVGLALDRSGFTVEDRDRAQGLYFVRYVDPKFAGREEPGFFSKLFSFGRKNDDASTLSRYRVSIKAEGDNSTVSVLDAKGAPENGDVGKRIVGLLVDDLK